MDPRENGYLQWLVDRSKNSSIATPLHFLASKWIKHASMNQLCHETMIGDIITLSIKQPKQPMLSRENFFQTNYDTSLTFCFEKTDNSTWVLTVIQHHANSWQSFTTIKEYKLTDSTESEYKGILVAADGKAIIVQVMKNCCELIKLPEKPEDSEVIQDAEMDDAVHNLKI